jgi:hypothetical protein
MFMVFLSHSRQITDKFDTIQSELLASLNKPQTSNICSTDNFTLTIGSTLQDHSLKQFKLYVKEQKETTILRSYTLYSDIV